MGTRTMRFVTSLPRTAQEILLLHDPDCSASRELEALLVERGVAFRERRQDSEPLTREELADLAERLCRPPLQWTRRDEAAWSELGLDSDSSSEGVLDALASHPELIERPILVRGGLAALGRPPESALDLL